MKLLKPVDLQNTIDLVFQSNFKEAFSEFQSVKEKLQGEIPLLLSMELELIEKMLLSQMNALSVSNLDNIRSWSKLDWSEFDSPVNSISVLSNACVVLALSDDFNSAKELLSACSGEIGRYISVIPSKFLIRNFYHLGLLERLLGNADAGFQMASVAYEIANQTILAFYPNHPEGISVAKFKNHFNDKSYQFPFWFDIGLVPIQLMLRL